ncbi:MAG: hemolysin family protein [Thermoleophilia bacterium]
MTAAALVGIAALVLVNAFFVAAEFALVSVRRGQVRGASLASRLARRQQAKLDQYLSACQLGITIASLALGALGEPTLAGLIEPALESAVAAHAAAIIGSLLAILVMTTIHITIGEQAPKSFAIGSAPVVARACALPLEVFYRALRPLVVVLNAASNWIVRLLGGTPASSHAQQASLEELRQLIGGLTEEGHVDADDAQILRGVFTLDERRAADVMSPRTRVVSVRAGQTIRGALAATRDSGHSRFPLLGPKGEPVGLVRTRELADALLDDRGDEDVAAIARPLLIVPETVRLDTLLTRLKEERASLCAVADEYGTLAGVVSVEDVVEEIVGEIWDEDDRPSGVRVLPDGRVVCRGDTSLLDLAENGIVLDGVGTGALTIGGLVQDTLGRLPREGDTIRRGSLRARVLATDGDRIKRVLVASG